MTLGDLKQKDVINTLTGASLGKPMDIEFCACDGRVSALVVPGEFSLSALFRGERCGIVIPWENICKTCDDAKFETVMNLPPPAKLIGDLRKKVEIMENHCP